MQLLLRICGYQLPEVTIQKLGLSGDSHFAGLGGSMMTIDNCLSQLPTAGSIFIEKLRFGDLGQLPDLELPSGVQPAAMSPADLQVKIDNIDSRLRDLEKLKELQLTRTMLDQVLETYASKDELAKAVAMVSHIGLPFDGAGTADLAYRFPLESKEPLKDAREGTVVGFVRGPEGSRNPTLVLLRPENQSVVFMAGIVTRSSYFEANVHADETTPFERICMIGIVDIHISGSAKPGEMIVSHPTMAGVGRAWIGGGYKFQLGKAIAGSRIEGGVSLVRCFVSVPQTLSDRGENDKTNAFATRLSQDALNATHVWKRLRSYADSLQVQAGRLGDVEERQRCMDLRLKYMESAIDELSSDKYHTRLEGRAVRQHNVNTAMIVTLSSEPMSIFPVQYTLARPGLCVKRNRDAWPWLDQDQGTGKPADVAKFGGLAR